MQYRDAYLCIDLERSGRRLESLMRQRGYSVRDIQDILQLSCPQPIYRWLRGQALPSVDHLFILARVFQVHMEDMLVAAYRPGGAGARARWKRMYEYRRRYLLWVAA